MKRRVAYLIAASLVCLASCDKEKDSSEGSSSEEIVFQARTYTFANAKRPYRRAEINLKDGVTPCLAVYLHGGSSRGDDNNKQIEEPAVQRIAEYVKSKGISAIFIVPQCPEADSQGKTMDWVKMGNALEYLIKSERQGVNSKVFLFGGSMGGTGTWNMLSAYPDLITAAMACAGKPGEYKFDTEEGWDHEKTCKESYTASRLEWVFSHK
ncbi:MAG: hypothetical protein IJK05_01270 [Bacteroidales bacterium]|nr:hypothetical protein [Bacteroidales bacterium]